MTEHQRLTALMTRKPDDYEPWGNVDRDEDGGPTGDCSCGCRYARWLEGLPDWCVCTNPESHRCGLLTFEHQGCRKFEGSGE